MKHYSSNILGGNPVEQFSSFQFGSFKPGLTSSSSNGSAVDDNFENGIGKTLELLFQPLHLLGTCIGSIRHSVITIIDNEELNMIAIRKGGVDSWMSRSSKGGIWKQVCKCLQGLLFATTQTIRVVGAIIVVIPRCIDGYLPNNVGKRWNLTLLGMIFPMCGIIHGIGIDRIPIENEKSRFLLQDMIPNGLVGISLKRYTGTKHVSKLCNVCRYRCKRPHLANFGVIQEYMKSITSVWLKVCELHCRLVQWDVFCQHFDFGTRTILAADAAAAKTLIEYTQGSMAVMV
mmetsp:Transcript_16670/g.30162  ORF Transcript_16670/g.30162 Transcript_16670/m.30162 type:complete len:288 (+) Transcript_16670:395-1258(+)